MNQIQRWVSSQRFRGQDMTNETYREGLSLLGVEKTRSTQGGVKVTMFKFPTIEGIEWKLRSMHWFMEE